MSKFNQSSAIPIDSLEKKRRPKSKISDSLLKAARSLTLEESFVLMAAIADEMCSVHEKNFVLTEEEIRALDEAISGPTKGSQ